MHPLFVWLFFSFFVSIFFYPPKFSHFEENLLVALQYWDKYLTPSFQSGNSWSYFFWQCQEHHCQEHLQTEPIALWLLFPFPILLKSLVFLWGLPILTNKLNHPVLLNKHLYVKNQQEQQKTVFHAECRISYWLNSLSKITFPMVRAKPHRSNPDTNQEEIVCKLVRSTKISLWANTSV